MVILRWGTGREGPLSQYLRQLKVYIMGGYANLLDVAPYANLDERQNRYAFCYFDGANLINHAIANVHSV